MALAETVIACVSDDDGFAEQVYTYLLPALQSDQLNKGNNIRIGAESVRLNPAENEIVIDGAARVPNDLIRKVLRSFLKQDPAKYKEYDVIEFGGGFTIGRVLPPSEMEMHTCEICGFFSPYSEEIQTHRMTHFGI